MRKTFFIFFLFWNCCLSAQLNGKYSFRHLDPSDGLLHTSIRGIGQDERGFIWILTPNGLQRYDGFRFVNFPGITEHSSSFAMNDSELFIDTTFRQVIVSRVKEIDRLDLSNNQLTTMTREDVLKVDTMIKPDTFIDEKKNRWILSQHGERYFENNTSKIIAENYDVNATFPNRGKYTIKDIKTGNYWTHDFRHFLIADGATHKMHKSSDSSLTDPLLIQFWKRYADDSRIRFLLLDSYNNLWISTWRHHLHRYNLDSKEFFTYSLKDVKKKEGYSEKGDLTLLIQSIYEDRQKNLWFATDYAGLLLYRRDKDDFDFITSDEKIKNGLRYNYTIYRIFQDRDDNLWLGTDRGISIFNPYQSHFRSIRHVDGNDASIPKNDITDLIETEQGEILIATWGGGISVYDKNWNFLRNIVFDGPPELNLVWSFVQNDDGMIWAGTQQGYIHIYDPVRHHFNTIHPAETNYSTIISMTKDHHGNILMGLNNGKITVWKKEVKKFYSYNEDAAQASLNLVSILDIHVDKSNRAWVTTTAGLQEFDIDQRCYIKLFQPDSTDSERGITMNGIEAYNDSMLILGSVYRGIFLFNLNTKKFSRLFMDEDLNHTSVFAIKRDPEGNLWFTSNFSLHKISPKELWVTRYNIDPAHLNAFFYSSHFHGLSDGSWVTNTIAEILIFHPGELSSDLETANDVQISGFKVYDKAIYIDSFMDNHRTVVLPYNRNFISIEFSSIDFNNVSQGNYYYRLSGVDPAWNITSTKTFADYTDLKPGNYIFEVKAENDGKFSAITSVPIMITPPWWASLWFQLLAILFIGSLIYWLLRKRIQLIRKQSELKHRVAETEMMALRSQMNPHFIFNCINGIDGMIQSNDKYRATMYLNKFAKLIRNVLESSKYNKVTLSKDIETLQLYIDLELFRHEGKFTASLHADDELLQNDYTVPPLIIQPYVENAILHGLRHRSGNEGKLNITITKNDHHIIYIIEDNGIGRKKLNGDTQKNTEGYGMQIGNDRVRLFNQEEIASIQITDLHTDGYPSGTRVQVNLKIQ